MGISFTQLETKFDSVGVILLLAGLIAGYGIFEYYYHQKRVRRIPIRIHVNGSRGKSSVTRLIAAGLRAGGVKVYGKTTGTSPRIIDPHGLEIPIHRMRGASIGEQVKMFRYFHRKRPEAVVMECMAIQPAYQWLSEHQMIHATIGVITNARPDHTREMGPGMQQIGKSLSNSIPEKAKAFTSEQALFPVMEKAAEQRQTTLQAVSKEDVTEEEMQHFNYVEHRDNVSLSIAVCKACGVDRHVALTGMYKVHPDPGALKLIHLRFNQTDYTFVNGFAANDPDSTHQIWQQLQEEREKAETTIVLLNSRIDRFPRTIQLIDMAADKIALDYLVIVGGRTAKARRHAIRQGFSTDKVIDLGEATPKQVFGQVTDLSGGSVLIFGMGNMGGGGGEIVEFFKYHTEFPGELVV